MYKKTNFYDKGQGINAEPLTQNRTKSPLKNVRSIENNTS